MLGEDKAQDGAVAEDATPVQDFKLGPDEELRFEVDANDDQFVNATVCHFLVVDNDFFALTLLLTIFVLVQLVDGTAEIFGTEMVKGKPYQFGPGAKLAIFTYHGCSVQLQGMESYVY